MFIGKRKNSIYFIEFFDANDRKIKRVSTGNKSKNLLSSLRANCRVIFRKKKTQV
jgi:hypothetical protein